MPHPANLLIYPRPGHRDSAHWAVFIPSTSNTRTGKVLETVGTPFSGYKLQFKGNYSLGTETRQHELLLIGQVDDEHVAVVIRDRAASIDVTAQDALEREAKKVNAPGVAKLPIITFEYENYQSWLKNMWCLLSRRN